jgi:xanthine/CO dehydrogenase XdhC/CoxF family maturation factor
VAGVTHDHAATDPLCALAHGDATASTDGRTLAAVFASPVATYLLHFGRDTGFRTVLVEPDLTRIDATIAGYADGIASAVDPSFADGRTDLVVCDHDRPELGDALARALACPARWIGVMGSLRHTAPHVAALRERGFDEAAIARVHRPIGLNIGSHTPPEIAIATLAGLIADRNNRPGGF